eukprot:6923864-Karenia_brevis.AAC.1
MVEVFEKALQQSQWERAAEHRNGEGLQQGADMYVVKQIHRQLKRDGYDNEAGMLKVIARGGLWLNQRKAEAGYQCNPICPLCKQEAEDEEHLFWRCPVAKANGCPEVQRTNHLASLALREQDKKAKWLRGMQPAGETIGILQPWEAGEEE